MLILLLQIFGISFVFHFYKNRYPNEYEKYSRQLFEYLKNNERLKPILPYMIKIGYALIYAFSYLQILLNNIITLSVPYVKRLRDKIFGTNTTTGITNINGSIKTIISFYKDGSLVSKQETANKFEDLTHEDVNSYKPPSVFNLTTFTVFNDDNKEERIVTNIPDKFEYELSSISFIALYLKQDDKTHIIDLTKYYVVGNIINSDFLKYYLVNILNIVIDDSKPFVYTLELMDHNVQMIYLDETQSIVFQKDGYIIEDGKKPELVLEEEVKEIKEEVNEIIEEVENLVKSLEEEEKTVNEKLE
jgi:hypothetical protein